MSAVLFSLASSNEEVESAFRLAVSVFGPSSGIDHYDRYKLSLWRDDPSYALDNFVLARTEDGSVCGLVRIVPRKVFRGEQAFVVAGISSVCLSPPQRGKGISVALMEHALEYCRQRKFDFSFLFARRAADHYYTRFGFQGISSYNQLKVRYGSLASDSRFETGPASETYVDVYRTAHDKCYSETFGRVERPPAYWRFLLRKFQNLGSPRLETLYFSGIPIGYVLWSDTTVHELAFPEPIDVRGLIAFLGQRLPSAAIAGHITFDMPPQHALVPAAYGLDMSLTTRECSFGGHMACILNPIALLERIAERSPQRASELAPLKGLRRFEHRETCHLLGISTITDQETSNDTMLPYNMSIADHF